MSDSDLTSLMTAASERQLAVAALQKKYEQGQGLSTEQLVTDMRELLATERVVLDAIITLFVKLSHLDIRSPALVASMADGSAEHAAAGSA